MEVEQGKLNSLAKEVFNAIKRYADYIDKNGVSNSQVEVTKSIKEDGISRATYKGDDGLFRVTVDMRVNKTSVMCKFGDDKYEVLCDKTTWIVKGVRPIFHPYWAMFNSVF